MSDQEGKSKFQTELDAIRAQRVVKEQANASKESAQQAAQEKFAKEGRPQAQAWFKQLKTDALAQIAGNEDLVKEKKPTFFGGRVFELEVNSKFLVAVAFEPTEAEVAISYYDNSIHRQTFVPNTQKLNLGDDAQGQLFYGLAWSDRHSEWRWQRLSKKYPSRLLTGNTWDKLFAKEKGTGPNLSYEELLQNVQAVIISLIRG